MPERSGWSLRILAGLAVVGALYVGRVILAPFALAVVAAAALRPLVRRCERWRIPAPVSATVLIFGGVAVVVVLGIALADPVGEWASKTPAATAAVNRSLHSVRERLAELGWRMGPSTAAERQATPPEGLAGELVGQAVTGTVKAPALAPFIRRAFPTTTAVVIGILEFLIFLGFMLAAGDSWGLRLKAAAGTYAEGERLMKLADQIREAVAHYLLVTLVLNIAQAVVVGLVLWMIGMPAPLLWGLATAVAEFVPYIGGFVMMILLALAGLVSAPDLHLALLAPACYLLITTLQNNVATPLLFGRGLTLNPVAILLAAVIWWALWGVAGAFLAIPFLAAAKLVAEYHPPLRPLAAFLQG